MPTPLPARDAAAAAAPRADPPAAGFGHLPDYAELHCRSNFSFLQSASHPHELVQRAAELGYRALAITDDASLAGIVRAHQAAREAGLALIVGSRFQVHWRNAAGQPQPPFTLIALAADASGYAHLCERITRLRRAAPKGRYRLDWPSIAPAEWAGCLLLAALPRAVDDATLQPLAQQLAQNFAGRCWLAVELHRRLDDTAWLARLRALSAATGLPLTAAGDVRLHDASRQPLLDVLTAIRLGRPLADCGHALPPNAECRLRSRAELAAIYPPELLAETVRIAARCQFALDQLRYQYPRETVPAGETPDAALRRLTFEGARRRWPQGVPERVRALLEHELALIAELGYAHYFLTVYDLVDFARRRGILCQGRGSAANSAVCYSLGITEVDPARMSVLFERFISRERNEPPDIDVDFEHERREEVIQYLYARYGRDRAALTAALITYRPRSAVRDVGKALGFAPAVIDRLARNLGWWNGRTIAEPRLREVGLDPHAPAVRRWMALVQQLLGFPRHLSQHTGGFVLSETPLSQLVPIENAAMPDRTVIQWDKDDLDAVGLMKVDVLALGMLSAVRRALDFIATERGSPFALQDIPAEDPQTYAMLSRADSVGVFQVESRAQQSMLPRLQPRCFYDLVIEVAIVRPGPIQGGMVHPYLNRRQGREPVRYPSEALRAVLQRTLGVPVFQEQVMQIAIVAAGFSPGEADGLRRAMAAWRRTGQLERWRQRLIDGLRRNGYADDFAQAIYAQIQGFSEYGFPESHAASFALLVYVSAWIKRHHPAAFLAALLNSQPMGFYTPSQLVQDARRHGVIVRPVDVQHSDRDCTLEPLSPAVGQTPAASTPAGVPLRPAAPVFTTADAATAETAPAAPDSDAARFAVRLGLRFVKGLAHAAAQRIVDARQTAPFADVDDLAQRAALDAAALRQLAAADALRSLAGHRRQQAWQAAAPPPRTLLGQPAPVREPPLALPAPPEGEDVLFDYAATGLTLRRHPLALLRPLLARRGLRTAAELAAQPDGAPVRACGLVTLRQQPATAGGVTFVSLEDETGAVQVICWKRLRERQRHTLLHARLLAVSGTWQQQDGVRSLIAARLHDLTPLLGQLPTRSRDFH